MPFADFVGYLRSATKRTIYYIELMVSGVCIHYFLDLTRVAVTVKEKVN
jgi:hypothetical protein